MNRFGSNNVGFLHIKAEKVPGVMRLTFWESVNLDRQCPLAASPADNDTCWIKKQKHLSVKNVTKSFFRKDI